MLYNKHTILIHLKNLHVSSGYFVKFEQARVVIQRIITPIKLLSQFPVLDAVTTFL